MKTSQCSRCRKTKPLKAFSVSKAGWPQAYCKECQSEYSKERYREKKKPKKYCPRCEAEKTLGDFYVFKDGTSSRYCKPCSRSYQRVRYNRQHRGSEVLEPMRAIKICPFCGGEKSLESFYDARVGRIRQRCDDCVEKG